MNTLIKITFLAAFVFSSVGCATNNTSSDIATEKTETPKKVKKTKKSCKKTGTRLARRC